MTKTISPKMAEDLERLEGEDEAIIAGSTMAVWDWSGDRVDLRTFRALYRRGAFEVVDTSDRPIEESYGISHEGRRLLAEYRAKNGHDDD